MKRLVIVMMLALSMFGCIATASAATREVNTANEIVVSKEVQGNKEISIVIIDNVKYLKVESENFIRYVEVETGRIVKVIKKH